MLRLSHGKEEASVSCDQLENEDTKHKDAVVDEALLEEEEVSK